MHYGYFGKRVVHAAAPYCYRCPFKLEYPSCGVACADDVEEIINTTTTGNIAAFMAETILGVGGFIIPQKEYFPRVAEIGINQSHPHPIDITSTRVPPAPTPIFTAHSARAPAVSVAAV